MPRLRNDVVVQIGTRREGLPLNQRRVTLELTNACQLKCKMCPRNYVDMKIGYMPDMFFRSLVSQLPQTATIFPFWRGESSLYPWFEDLMLFAKQWAHNGRVVIATNGIALNGPRLWGFMAAHVVSVSIHNNMGYQGLLNLLRERRTNNPKLHVAASIVEGERTGINPKALKVADEVRIYEEHTKKGVWGSIGLRRTGVQEWCSRLDTDLVIAWDGSVSRCCYVWDPIPGLSAISMSLKEILASPQFKAIRENYPDKICSKCSQWIGKGKTL